MNKLKSEILKYKKASGKTQTGRKVGWMVDCKYSKRALLSLCLSNPANILPPLVLVGSGLRVRKEF